MFEAGPGWAQSQRLGVLDSQGIGILSKTTKKVWNVASLACLWFIWGERNQKNL